jgi:hypothetical protein
LTSSLVGLSLALEHPKNPVHVAVAGGMKNGIVQTESGPARVAIFALPNESKP